MTTLLARDLVRTFRKHSPDLNAHVLPEHFATMYRPGVQFHNVAFDTIRHRKLHVETEHIGMVQAVHSSLYPRPQYDAPILTMDIVTIGDAVTHAFLDACPSTSNLVLPREYDDAFQDIQTQYGLTSTKRHLLPDYGRSIFSRRCYVGKGIDPVMFTRFAIDCVAMHVEYVKQLDVSRDHRENRNNQQRYSRQQRQNPKKRELIAGALGGDMELTEKYLAMIFD